MVKLLKISRQGYYKVLKQKDTSETEAKTVQKLVFKIRQTLPRCGGYKLHEILRPELKKRGMDMGKDKFFKILREQHLLVPRRKNFVKTTRSYHRYRKHPNLLKDKALTKPEQAWVSDITYIRTRKGFVYLSLITDAYSKKIMGYEVANSLKTENSIKALKMAIKNRKYGRRKLIHHSDRGFQYCNPSYTDILDENKINISMTTKYDPYENAIAERVNGILKDEFLLDKTFIDRKQAMREVRMAINAYNNVRPHITCQMMTPEKAHRKGRYKLKKWNRNFSSMEASIDEKRSYI